MKKLILLILFPAIISGCTLIPKKSSQQVNEKNTNVIVNVTNEGTMNQNNSENLVFPDDYILLKSEIPVGFTLLPVKRIQWDAKTSINSAISNFYTGITFNKVTGFWSDLYSNEQENIRVDIFRYVDNPSLGGDVSALFRQEKKFTTEEKIIYSYYRNAANNVIIVISSNNLDSEAIANFGNSYLKKDHLKLITGDVIKYTEAPDVYEGYGEKLILSGIKTEYPAHKFKEQGYILFAENNILKTIEINAPYLQNILTTNVEIDGDFSIGNCKNIDGLYLCEMWADGPGQLIRIFIFNPKTKDFIFVKDGIKGFNSGKNIKFVSSLSDKVFSAKYSVLSCVVNNEMCMDMNDVDEMEIDVNGKNYNVDQFKNNVDNIKTLFECNGRYDYSGISAGWSDDATIDSVNFPPKRINCLDYNNKNSSGDPSVRAYFDLEQSKFVVTK